LKLEKYHVVAIQNTTDFKTHLQILLRKRSCLLLPFYFSEMIVLDRDCNHCFLVDRSVQKLKKSARKEQRRLGMEIMRQKVMIKNEFRNENKERITQQ